MPALSFQGEWLDKLLSGSKQQTTRSQTNRIKVGDICNIYNQQRKKIVSKPLRQLTDWGYGKMVRLANLGQRKYPPVPLLHQPQQYPAHFLGKVRITAVYEIHPCEMSKSDLQDWARADGFKDFHPTVIPPDRLYDGANMWFQRRYGEDWMRQAWTVIRWNGWIERYFEPGEP